MKKTINNKQASADYGKMARGLLENRKWFTVNMEAEDPEILIYDSIGAGGWFGDDGVTPRGFREALLEIEGKSDRMSLRINSPGGIVHDGFAIYNMLKQSKLKVTAHIDGLAASCASFIPMACDVIKMPAQSEMMIHNVWGVAFGTSKEMRAEADHIDSLQSQIVNIYAERTGLDKEEISEMMSATTWMGGERAVELGFADELSEPSLAAACAFDYEQLPGLPEGFKKYQTALRKRAVENSLRDAGMSRAEAARRASNSERDKDIREEAGKLIAKEIGKCLS